MQASWLNLELSLIRRAAAIECELEQMEGKLSLGETVDLDAFSRSASHLRRILESPILKSRKQNNTSSSSFWAAAASFQPQQKEPPA